MKNILSLFILTSILFACNPKNNSNADKNDNQVTEVSALKTIELRVTGMTCEGCEHSVETALTGVNGVVSAKASHLNETTIISYDSTKVKSELIAETINGLGYHVEN